MITKLPSSKQQSAFTLIELLIVIAILGVLAVALLAIFNPLAQMQKARDSRRKTDLREIKTSVMLYRNICDFYPSNNASKQIMGCNTCSSPSVCDWGVQWSVNGDTIIMKILPKDPKSPTQNYQYSKDPIGADKFTLATCLENQYDPAGQQSRDRCGSTGLTCSGGTEYIVCED